MRAVVVAVALAMWMAVLAQFAAAADAEAKTLRADAARHFVFFSDTGPVLIKLHVQIHGKPLEAAWNEFIDAVIVYLDTNKDGAVTREEAGRAPPASLLFNSNPLQAEAGPAASRLDADRDGKVTKEELQQHYRENGGTPFQLQMQSGSSDTLSVLNAGQSGSTVSASTLNAGLLSTLDSDGDGKLSRDEMTAAATTLMKRDADDNEVVTPEEAADSAADGADQAANRDRGAVLQMFLPNDSPSELVRQLLNRYSGADTSARQLSRKAIGLSEAAFKELDANGDGALDRAELAGFLRRRPDVELIVRLGTVAQNEAALELVGDSAATSAAARKSEEELTLIERGATRVKLRVGGETQVASIRGTYVQQFRNADRDNNNYLDMNEARENRWFLSVFKLLDADGDGKMFQEEMTAYLDQLKELRAKAASGCVSMSVSDPGRGLFDVLDTNRDGRIGLRDMRAAETTMSRLDVDRDGHLTSQEIPQTYLGNLSLGPVPAQGVVSVTMASAAKSSAADGLPGPVWFRKMDRNRDGDVSQREFLGTAEQFSQIDVDRDGLIGVDEAARADTLLRR